MRCFPGSFSQSRHAASFWPRRGNFGRPPPMKSFPRPPPSAVPGLTRAWVDQGEFDVGRSRLQSLMLYDGTLFAQSSRATLEALDAETGQRLWSKLVGQPGYPSLAPGACKDLVATVNGSRLDVLNRYTGDILYQTSVDGVPASAAARATSGPTCRTRRA